MKEGICKTCGKVFIRNIRHKTYCSAECKMKMDRYRWAARRKKKKSNLITIAEINRKAFAEGLTYGQYVAKYGF